MFLISAQEVQKKPSGSEENAYEDFNYDDGSYEAVSVGAQVRFLHFHSSFSNFMCCKKCPKN